MPDESHTPVTTLLEQVTALVHQRADRFGVESIPAPEVSVVLDEAAAIFAAVRDADQDDSRRLVLNLFRAFPPVRTAGAARWEALARHSALPSDAEEPTR
ncbi:hypothetical protein CFC35_41755 [Streptomyces sp. FBKL.4005]|uniref:hypothetical protein n=1 Tax=Streptomyces sp. FBKL.4005 TaxID=2015515 RepID=UPI000B95D7C1|nr:hypothetical protein [Streptomyces sp. FBKL.4005]OYP10044.1 hypothetical protein CFC35_41755 [Streptomyces sp. FBKL.4005]